MATNRQPINPTLVFMFFKEAVIPYSHTFDRSLFMWEQKINEKVVLVMQLIGSHGGDVL